MKKLTPIILVSAGLLLSAVGLRADPPTTNPHTPPDPGVPANAGKGSAESDAVRALIKQFETQRDQYLAARKALLDQLKNATTEDQKKQILAQLQADQKTQIEEQRALAKQIRDELKTLRQQRKSGNGG